MLLLHLVSFFLLTTPTPDIVIRDVLTIPPVGRSARAATHTDAIEAQIVAGKWTPPTEGDKVESPLGVRTWKKISAGKDDWFQDSALQGGYAYARVESPTSRVAILEAAGHGMVYVNGEPRAGDPYGFGYLHLPIQLKQGGNDFLFAVGRGRLRVKLTEPKAPIFIDTSDTTLPDLISCEKRTSLGGIVVVNASTEPVRNLEILTFPNEGVPVAEPLPQIPPLSVRKVPIRFGPWTPVRNPARKEMKVALLLRKRSKQPVTIFRTDITLRLRQPGQTYKRTFISGIDGSVQYYAVNPAMMPSSESQAIFLSLHGAGVEAIGQADAYSPKRWGNIVCPTNRRPYGFDWEDWGRLDAMEVLEQVLSYNDLHPDRNRVYLTGHSMGGHGVWQIGATLPSHFAAIGPSAGWISFRSYAGASVESNPSPVQQIMQRATSPSDTLALASNYAEQGVYVLHGDADDNVPILEARTMVKRLSEFHHDYQFHEQKGAGHWWDSSPEPGADCVDWLPMFDLFSHHRRPDPEEVRQIDFTTINPVVSAGYSGIVAIGAQEHPLVRSNVKLQIDPLRRSVTGTTENVAKLMVRPYALAGDEPYDLTLDGQTLRVKSSVAWLIKAHGNWSLDESGEIWIRGKNGIRGGPLKEAFRYRFILVYGTKGSPAENAWAFSKARYDAETWLYRGNGAVDVLSDSEFLARKGPNDQGVILYGNADTNGAWSAVIPDNQPVQLRRGSIQIGNRAEKGEDLACLFIQPRRGCQYACVGVVGGTGLAGMRLTERLPYFVSGVAYPDVTLIGPEMLDKGSAGVRAAGFFGNDWKAESGELAWRDEEVKR